MKPFDLPRALAGDPVVTRDGRSVKIAGHNQDALSNHRIAGWLDNWSLCGWHDNGNYNARNSRSPLDLVMAPKKRKITIHINWYPSGNCSAWRTKEDAESNALPDCIACTEHTIEVDEE